MIIESVLIGLQRGPDEKANGSREGSELSRGPRSSLPTFCGFNILAGVGGRGGVGGGGGGGAQHLEIA